MYKLFRTGPDSRTGVKSNFWKTENRPIEIWKRIFLDLRKILNESVAWSSGCLIGFYRAQMSTDLPQSNWVPIATYKCYNRWYYIISVVTVRYTVLTANQTDGKNKQLRNGEIDENNRLRRKFVTFSLSLGLTLLKSLSWSNDSRNNSIIVAVSVSFNNQIGNKANAETKSKTCVVRTNRRSHLFFFSLN